MPLLCGLRALAWVDAVDALHGADMECILGAAVAGEGGVVETPGLDPGPDRGVDEAVGREGVDAERVAKRGGSSSEVARWCCPERLLEHHDEGGGRFVTQVARHSLDRRAAGEFAQRDHQVQLPPPSAKGQPGFLNHQPLQ